MKFIVATLSLFVLVFMTGSIIFAVTEALAPQVFKQIEPPSLDSTNASQLNSLTARIPAGIVGGEAHSSQHQ